MKYLRLYTEGFRNEDYFNIIDEHEWWDCFYNRIEMSSRTIDFISKLFSLWDLGVDDNGITVNNNRVSVENYDYQIRVYEVEDEYFYVWCLKSSFSYIGLRRELSHSASYYYKCDQLEGLESFLKSVHIIK